MGSLKGNSQTLLTLSKRSPNRPGHRVSRRRAKLQQSLLDHVELLSDEWLGVAVKLVEALKR
jgi:hypothetical protein